MRTFLKLFHFLAVSAFVGSIFGHILLGNAFRTQGMETYFPILLAKARMTDVLILGGIALCALSGLGMLMLNKFHGVGRPWLPIKLAAVALITVNTLLILRPVGLKRVELAQNLLAGTEVQPAFLAAGATEDIFGTLNLALVLIVIGLSIAKRAPFISRLRQNASALG